MNIFQDVISKYRVYYCLDCGKCASVCPITHWETRDHASPRLLIEKTIQGKPEPVMDDHLFWACLTCKRCTELCPSDVHFSEFLMEARSLARQDDRSGDCTHSEMIQTLGRMMTNPDMKQNRLDWLDDGLETSTDSDTLYFVGCMPYYDPIFKKFEVEGVEIAQAAVKILNHMGIKPQVLADERCCGHDQLWQGDIDTFKALAALNIDQIKSSGIKRIVSTCPECTRTLKIDYPHYLGDHGLEILHLTELLAENSELLSNVQAQGLRVTYQDPCRLGRHLGAYDAPRKVMDGIGLELTEMARHAGASLCCGTSSWSSCGQVSKNIQVERLEEARATNADVLVTTCQKCQIHFKCAQNDPLLGEDLSIELRDLTTLVAEGLSEHSEQIDLQEVSIGD